MGVILAGWASNNKWSVYGAMREACQMVSYEIPLGLSIIVGVMAAGTLNLVPLGHQQGGGVHTWLIFRNPFTFLRVLHLLRRQPGDQQASAVRSARKRIGTGRGISHGIQRAAIFIFLLRRICGDVCRRRNSGGAVPRWMERSVRTARLGVRTLPADLRCRSDDSKCGAGAAVQCDRGARFSSAKRWRLSSCRCGFAGRCPGRGSIRCCTRA